MWSNRCRGSFQQELQACQLITRYGVVNSFTGWVKPLIRTTGHPAAQARPEGEADEQRRVTQQPRPFHQRQVAGHVLGAVGDLGPHQAKPVHRFLVDADDAVAVVFQVSDDTCQPLGLVQYFQPLLLCTATTA